jgi:hypothetical protein
MKKLALIPLLFATMVSCSADEIKKEEQKKDCNCNRVVQIFTLNVVAGNGNVGTTKMYKYITINDCNGVQRESGWSTGVVKENECR